MANAASHGGFDKLLFIDPSWWLKGERLWQRLGKALRSLNAACPCESMNLGNSQSVTVSLPLT